MKQSQAEKAIKVIELWLKSKPKEYMANVSLVSADHNQKEWGVRLSVDGEAYDDLYTNEGYYLSKEEAEEFRGYGAKDLKVGSQGGSRAKLEKELAKRLGWKTGAHYFENVTSGIMEMY